MHTHTLPLADGSGAATGDAAADDLDSYDPASAGLDIKSEGPLLQFDPAFQELQESDLSEHPRHINTIMCRFCAMDAATANSAAVLKGLAQRLAPTITLSLEDAQPVEILHGAHICLFAIASTNHSWNMPPTPRKMDCVPTDKRVISLLHTMASHYEKRLTFRFLVYLRYRSDALSGDDAKGHDDLMRPYLALAILARSIQSTTTIDNFLTADLEIGRDDSEALFLSVIPFVFDKVWMAHPPSIACARVGCQAA